MTQPSLRALRAFAETTRTGSLAAAASTLNVTPSAISHLIRELHQTLGIPLTTGKGRLSEAGDRLGRRLTAAFDAIDAAVAEARHSAADVRVSALSTFLTLWLVPRLSGFQARYPQTRLLLSTGMRPVDLSTEPFECALRWGRGDWPDLEKMLLFRDQPVVVLNPRLLKSNARPEDLPRLAGRTRPDDWPLVAAALAWPEVKPILTFETRALAVQAAIAGMGAAVVDRNLIAGMLADGLLTEIAPDPPVAVPEGHWFVAHAERLSLRPVRQFRDWLIEQTGTPKSPLGNGGPFRS